MGEVMNIIELAKQARFFVVDGEVYSPSNQADHELTRFLQAFAALVEAAARADEREACAALCFSIWNKWLDTPEEDRYKVLYDAEDCAAAIRARRTT